MGVLAGSIVSGAMLAMMMANAGGAWDNSKKLCEKLHIKKTEQGKACIVGDTVGDPFKDTSGPALNILIKLMSMVSLTIAPLLKDENSVGNSDWENWYYGMIPLAVICFATTVLMCLKILTWDNPLKDIVKREEGVMKVESEAIVIGASAEAERDAQESNKGEREGDPAKRLPFGRKKGSYRRLDSI